MAKDQVEACRREHQVISTRLFAGQTILHVYGENDPGDGFAAVEPGLEDVYFHTLSNTRAELAPSLDS